MAEKIEDMIERLKSEVSKALSSPNLKLRDLYDLSRILKVLVEMEEGRGEAAEKELVDFWEKLSSGKNPRRVIKEFLSTREPRRFDKNDMDNEWLAAALDGEGCITLKKSLRKGYRSGYRLAPSVRICNTNKDFIIKITRVLNLKFYGQPSRKDWKKIYSVDMGSKSKIIDFLTRVLPYLVIKKKQAILLLTFCVRRIAGPYHKPYTEDDLKIRKIIMELNRRGVSRVN